jgi:Fe2+ or Zn2+ uptake regulation protein
MRVELHQEVERRLASHDQRYTGGRRALVEVLLGAGRPLTIPEVLARSPGVPQSSAYRNLTVLVDVGAARRVTGAGEHGRFELAEDITGHHHHAICTTCGTVIDIHGAPRLERALEAAALAAGSELGFVVSGHTIDLLGTCGSCLAAPARSEVAVDEGAQHA